MEIRGTGGQKVPGRICGAWQSRQSVGSVDEPQSVFTPPTLPIYFRAEQKRAVLGNVSRCGLPKANNTEGASVANRYSNLPGYNPFPLSIRI